MYTFTISMIFFWWEDSNKVLRLQESQISHKKQLPMQDLTKKAYRSRYNEETYSSL
jgi:hypothetical protein